MRMERPNLFPYYTEYTDTDGHQHYAVHMYRKTDGWVWTMRDYKFPGLQYPQSSLH